MNMSMLRVCLLLVAIVFIQGCRTAPLMNVTESGINPGSGKEATLQEVTQAILGAATSTRPAWSMNVIKPGHILATLYNRSHMAAVDITYTTTSYNIAYKESTNLKYDAEGPTIHANYNSWIQNLDTAIKGQLNAI